MPLKKKIFDLTLPVLSGTPILGKKLSTFSTLYSDYYRGFIYDIQKNGEMDLLRVLARHFDKEFRFFDVGANVGKWTGEVITHFKAYEGHLFELSDTTFKTLTDALNGKGNLYLNQVALGDECKTISFQNYGENSVLNSMVTNLAFHKGAYSLQEAQCITGVAYCQQNQIDSIHFLKIDVEGFEYPVLQGFKPMLENQSIACVQFEYGYANGDEGHLMRDFFEFFTSLGYKIGVLRKDGVHFKDFEYSDNDFKSGPNYVACVPQLADIIQKF